MKFDVSKLKEMNDLDFEQVALWPFEVKVVVGIFAAILAGLLSYFTMISNKLPALESAQQKEIGLKQDFRVKAGIAANLQAYEQQLAQIQQDFSSMLKSLPTSNETPGLLDDITQMGTRAGLSFRLIRWQPEVVKEFYTELPIEMEVVGGYHQIGQFVSDVAALPRIVTFQDFVMEAEGGQVRLQLQAKTYRTGGEGEATQ